MGYALRRNRTAAVALAVAVLGSVAIWLQTGVAQAASSNDPTCGTPITGTPITDTGAAANGYVLNVGGNSELAKVWDPTGGFPTNKQSTNPMASSRDIVGPSGAAAKQVDLQFSEGLDVTTDTTPQAHIGSTDSAATFPTTSYYNNQFAGPYTVLRDGSLLGAEFKPVAHSGSTTTFRLHRSSDGGATWTSWDSVVETGVPLAGEGRVFRAPLELADGRILVGFYASTGSDSTDGSYRSMAAVSADGGLTFPSSAVLAKGTNNDSYNEAGLAQLNNGTVVAVIRHAVYKTASKAFDLSTPVEVTSTDGVHFSAPASLSVTWPYGYDPIDDTTKTVTGIAPDLKLMPNGVLMLSSGRPDNWVAMSTNGLGTGWVGQLTYRNCPTSGYRYHGSTGNTGETSVESNRLAQFGDNCDITWSCDEASESGFTVSHDTALWRRFVDVLTPDTGKIDLATKYQKNKIQVTTNMTYTSAAHPRTGVAGAFDGSTEYWSSAVSANTAGSFVIQLDKQYDLTRIGLALRNGRPESATVSLSTDGTSWTTPVVNVGNRTDLALNYQAFATPQAARFVKVDIPATSTCDSAVAASCAFLNELELYSTTDSFENDPVNTRPRGYTELDSAWVTRSDTDDSSRALRLNDTSGSQAKAAGSGTAATSKTLEFRVDPVSLPNGFVFEVRGKNSAGSVVTTYEFAVAPDGHLRWYNGTWHELTGAGVVPAGQWSSVSVAAGLNSAAISVNGTQVATTAPSAAGATTLSSFVFASDGSQPTGDNIVVDDVKF
jgi:hypothetical protein